MSSVIIFHRDNSARDKIIKVAEIIINGTRQECLNSAFKMTQNIESSWSRSKNFKLFVELPVYEGVVFGLRSTSISDHISVDGVEFYVDTIGFLEIVN
jgi:hypothetical protein